MYSIFGANGAIYRFDQTRSERTVCLNILVSSCHLIGSLPSNGLIERSQGIVHLQLLGPSVRLYKTSVSFPVDDHFS